MVTFPSKGVRMSYRVLVVDDERNVVVGLKRHLRGRGFDVVLADSAPEAMGIMEHISVDVLLTDHMMPYMTGTELLAWSRENYPSTVRMLCTGHLDADVAVAAVNKGEVFRIFVKPCSSVELVIGIRQALEHRELLLRTRQLVYTLQSRERSIEGLEREHPGISDLRRDSSGAIVIDDPLIDVNELIEQLKVETDRLGVKH